MRTTWMRWLTGICGCAWGAWASAAPPSYAAPRTIVRRPVAGAPTVPQLPLAARTAWASPGTHLAQTLPAAAVPYESLPMPAPSAGALPARPSMAPPLTPPSMSPYAAPTPPAPAYAAPARPSGSGMFALPGAPQPTLAPGMHPYGGALDAPSTMPSASPADAPAAYGCAEDCCDPAVVFDPGLRWFGSVSGLVFTRSQANGRLLTILGNDPNAVMLNTRDTINGQWQGGYEARVGRVLGAQSAFEATWWQLSPFQSEKFIGSGTDQLNSVLDFNTGGPVIVDGHPASNHYLGAREQRLSRLDEFWNLELNLLRQPFLADPLARYGLTGLVGVRWFHFHEGLDYWSSVGGTTFGQFDGGNLAHYAVTTQNDLVGLQFGGRMHYYLTPGLRLFAMPKVGIYGNHIDLYSRLHCGCLDGGTDGFDERNDANQFSMLGQLDLGGAWQVSQRWSVYLSYRLMGVQNVALGDDQYAQFVASREQRRAIHSNGGLLLHGAAAGAQVAF